MFTEILLMLELSWISLKYDVKDFRASIRKERRNRNWDDGLCRQMRKSQLSRGIW